jgi:endogenous inhibitor of DNA gyrase (YacG/DUF329 family)
MGRMDRPSPCALCRVRPVDPRYRPFCSRRCQQEDLARWADGVYRVPGPPVALPDAGPFDPDDDLNQT